MSLTARSRPLQARHPRGADLWPALVLLLCLTSNAATPLKDQPHLRRPVAAAWIEPGKLLAVANSRSGSISIVNCLIHTVQAEVGVGEQLTDIVSTPKAGRLLAVDASRHDLIVLDHDYPFLRVASRISVSPYPVSVCISPSGGRVAVASLWSRRLSIYETNLDVASGAGLLRHLRSVDLPFNPRRQVFLPDGVTIVVADAFSGGLILVDAERAVVVGRPKTSFESIQAIALSQNGTDLIVANRSQLKPGKSTPYHLANSPIGTNFLTVFPITEISRNDGSPPVPRVHSPGNFETRVLAALPDGSNAIVTSSGIAAGSLWRLFSRQDNLGGDVSHLNLHRGFVTGDLALLYVNRFSDSVSVLEQGSKVPVTIALGPQSPLTPADRGEELFYGAKLLTHRWMSCHSCHTDGHTSYQLADTLGDGTKGTRKRIPTLLGTRLTDPWAWNGQVRSLNEQVRKSLETTMHARNIAPQQVDDITAFLHTLPPPPPLQPATDEPEDNAQLARGSALFNNLGCAKCHVPPLTYTSSDVYEVGLEDEKGLKKFNPPSLRGVSQGYAFFHDGRAKSLGEVFTIHGHQLDRPLEKAELADLLRFLRSL